MALGALFVGAGHPELKNCLGLLAADDRFMTNNKAKKDFIFASVSLKILQATEFLPIFACTNVQFIVQGKRS